MTTDSPVLTIGDVAHQFKVPAWRVRCLYERGLLPPAHRVGAYRVVMRSDLPDVENALRSAGYLPEAVAHGS